MTNRAKTWLAAAVPGVFLGSFALSTPRMFGLTGFARFAVPSAIVLLALAASLATWLVMRRKLRDEPQVEGGAEIDEAMAAAQARLATANLAADSRIARLPLALVLGPTGSTKTSIVMNSGLHPELLAGEVMRGDTVMATDPVNVWYAHGTIVVEAGGRLLEDAARWRRLVRHLEPRRLAAALGRGRQAPRVAVLCIPCDDFMKPGASQNLHTLARQLRARLGEASQQLGIRLPVYVVFTRADRLPFFADYVRSLTNEEATQVLGASLPLADTTGTTWAESESRRLNHAFGRIVHTLALRRLDLLPREAQEPVRAAAYEFPREVRKITEPAVQLLLDVFRPSQLGVNPFLRGFYFTGVRPVFIRDVAADAAPQRPAAAAVDAAATSVFSAAMLQQAVQASAGSGGGRKVPQWTFLPRVFSDIVLRDQVALNITGGGTRVDLLRRGMIGAAAAACLLLSMGFTRSFFANRELVRDAVSAAQPVADAGTLVTATPPERLARLDTLRMGAERAGRIDRERRPLRLRWGLYRGDDVHAHVRTLYFARFNDVLWRDTRQAMLDYLAALPAEPGPGADFQTAQAALAAHLLTTTHHERSTPDELVGPLLMHWDRRAAPELRDLAGQQFAYFAAELPHGNPYPNDVPDDRFVDAKRRYLLGFGADAYYSTLLASGNQAGAMRFTAGGDYVTNAKTVDGAFTIGGWRDVEDNLRNLDAMFERYRWLYGEATPANKPDPAELSRRYYADYARAWKDYLRSGALVAFGNPENAARRLEGLGAPTSPLFRMLRIASEQTNISNEMVQKSFEPVRALVAPDADDRNVTGLVRPYADALYQLSTQIRGLGVAGQAPDPAIGMTISQVRSSASTLANGFSTENEAAESAEVLRRLLLQPAEMAEALMRNAPKAELNAGGARFCDGYRTVGRLFPFNAQAPQEAAPGDVARIFGPGGQLAALFQSSLSGRVLTEAGEQHPGGPPVNPQFRSFYARAVDFRNAVYRGGDAAMLDLGLRFEIPAGATQVILQIDGGSETYSQARGGTRNLTWLADRPQALKLVVDYGSEQVTVAEATGHFALFRLFSRSRWSGSGPYRAEWPIPGRQGTLVGSVSLPAGVRPVLQPGYLAPLANCVSTIVN